MKKINLLKKLLFFCFISFISLSCGDDDDGSTPTPTPTDPLDAQAALLNGNWKVKDSNSVTKDGTIVDVFTTMTLNILEDPRMAETFLLATMRIAVRKYGLILFMDFSEWRQEQAPKK